MVSNGPLRWDNEHRTLFDTPMEAKIDTHYNEEAFASVCEVQCSEAANKKLMESLQEGSSVQAQQVTSLVNLRPLGLGLQITPSLLISVQKVLDNHYHSTVKEPPKPKLKLNLHLDHPPTKVDDDFVPCEKWKAANFNASLIRIGSWERTAKYENDLVVKFYFAKKRLVWEVMQNCRKSKIEFQWTDIIAIKATTNENEPGTLEIELNNPPSFYEEVDPQPRKHTIWRIALDFTGGEASRCRRHSLKFPPGALDKHYQQLLQREPRLLELSHKGFSSLSSPYFDAYNYGPTDFSFIGFNGGGGCPPIEFQFAPRLPSSIMATQPSFQKTISPISDDFIGNREVYENPGMGSLVHGVSNYAEVLSSVQGLMPTVSPPQWSSSATTQYYNLPTYSQEAQGVNFDPTLLTTIEKQLQGDVAPSDDRYAIVGVDSWTSLVNLANQQNNESDNSSGKVYYEHDRHIDSKSLFLNGNDGVHVLGRQFYQQLQPVSCRPLVSPGNPAMHPAWNNLGLDPITASVMTDPRIEGLINDDSRNGLGAHNHWS